MSTEAKQRLKANWKGVGLNREFDMHQYHKALQAVRRAGEGITLKQGLIEVWGEEMKPERFYRELGVDLSQMTVEKLITTSDLTRWLFPEIFRDAIRTGLEYAPFYKNLITGEERIASQGLTMPRFVPIPADNVRLRDTGEGATITEGAMVVYTEKQVSVKKKARGLKQTYESIMWTPIDLSRVYFEELGMRLGSDLDKDLITVALDGDQDDGSEAAPVIGAATANTLLFTDLVRAWVRFRRIGRTSTAMIMNEAEAITILSMDEFNNRPSGGGAGQFAGAPAPTLKFQTPLPTSQDIFVHEDVPAKNIIFVDPTRAFVQLTAMPLLVEGEKIVERQLNGEYVSIITGFANVFKDGRLLLDYSTNLATNAGPSAIY